MNQPAASAQHLPHPLSDLDADHELSKLIGYCDGLQALVDSQSEDSNVLDYLTPWSFRMLIEPVREKLTLLRACLPTG